MWSDFATYLVLGALITGLIWLVDRVVLAGRREEKAEGGSAPNEPWVVEYSRSLFPIIVIVLVVRSFVAEPFRIPSNSMMPTLLNGDLILVNKYAYGLRLPVVNWKIVDIGGPERGDVVVFRYPEDPSTNYIKRVIGLPEDRIEYRGKRVYINGKPLKYKAIGRFTGKGSGAPMTGARLLTEKLGDTEHRILLEDAGRIRGFPCLEGDSFTVPEGQYFVMGDNRDNSNDSRIWCGVPEENLVGKAFLIWMNFGPDGVAWSRIGDTIQ